MDKIKIVCITDDKFISYIGVMLTSLFCTNRPENVVAYIMTEGLSAKNRSKLHRLETKYNTCIEIIVVNDCRLSALATNVRSYYMRLLIPCYLPESINKVLYLDGDIMITQSLNELWQTNLNNYSVGAVVDTQNDWGCEHLGYDKHLGYFNAGVMLLNLYYWRMNSLVDVCFDCIRDNSQKFLCHDQDVLNIVLLHSKRMLHLKYNLQINFLLISNRLEKNISDEVEEIIKTGAVLVHYSRPRPWGWNIKYPYQDKWIYYKKQSLWHKFPDDCSKRVFIQRFFIRICYILRIKKSSDVFIEMQ